MKTIEQKYKASKIAIQKINTALPVLKELREKKTANYKAARQAFYDDIVPFVTSEEIADYPTVMRAIDTFTAELGILNGIKGWY